MKRKCPLERDKAEPVPDTCEQCIYWDGKSCQHAAMYKKLMDYTYGGGT